MNQPIRISVVMPVFNAEMHLRQTILSVLNQTYANFELIIVDDGSVDGSAKIIDEFRSVDKRIRHIRHQTNRGVSESRNAGIQRAQTSFIALVDADDLWEPEKLQVQLDYHDQTDCAFSCTAFWFGDKIVSSKTLVGYHDLLSNNIVNTSSVMIDTRIHQISFAHEFPSEDYQLWLKIARKAPIHFIQTPLVSRQVFNGESRNKIKMASQRWNIYRNHENLNLFLSGYYFFRYFLSGIVKYRHLILKK